MSVAKIIELVGCSSKSFDDAVKQGIETASETIRNITGARVIGKNVKVRDGVIIQYRVNLKIAFGVEEEK